MLKSPYAVIRARVHDGLLSKDVVKVAEYVFRTEYGRFPRAEDLEDFLPIVLDCLYDWKIFYKEGLEALRKQFFRDTVSELLEATKTKEA